MDIEKLPSPSMDNFEVKVTARSIEHLQLAIALAMSNHGWIDGFLVDSTQEAPKLQLYWMVSVTEKDVSKFPFRMTLEPMTAFVKGWLKEVEYGREPDLDGHCSKGWTLYTPSIAGWNHIAFSVEPVWAEHHK